jgi:hypothetical protein
MTVLNAVDTLRKNPTAQEMSVKIVKQTPSSTEIFDGTFPPIEDIN